MLCMQEERQDEHTERKRLSRQRHEHVSQRCSSQTRQEGVSSSISGQCSGILEVTCMSIRWNPAGEVSRC